MGDQTLQHKLTIVIPTFNRTVYLLRLLTYYQSKGFPYSIRILDSSAGDSCPQELKKFLQYPPVSYQRFDSSTFFVHKISEGMKKVTTPFSVLCADDDFLIPSGLEKCLEFLSQHEDYSCCHGRYILHQVNSKANQDHLLWMPNYQKAVAVDQETALGRFDFFFPDNYSGYPMYAIHKAQVHKDVWGQADQAVSDWGLSELFPSCLSIILGKMKILDCFYSSRETNLFEWVDEKARRRMYAEDKVEKVLINLAKNIDGIDQTGVNSVYAKVKEKITTFLKEREVIWSRTAPAQKTAFRKLLKKYLGPTKENWIRLQWLMRIKNYSLFYKELSHIRQHLFLFKMDREAIKNFRASYNI